MNGDVEVDTLISTLRTALPGSMSIAQLTITLSPSGSVTGTSTTPNLDVSGRKTIGTVTISGSAQTLDDLPAYIDRLSAVAGVVNVLPGTNATGTRVAQYNLTLSLTDELLSHRFATKAGK